MQYLINVTHLRKYRAINRDKCRACIWRDTIINSSLSVLTLQCVKD